MWDIVCAQLGSGSGGCRKEKGGTRALCYFRLHVGWEGRRMPTIPLRVPGGGGWLTYVFLPSFLPTPPLLACLLLIEGHVTHETESP